MDRHTNANAEHRIGRHIQHSDDTGVFPPAAATAVAVAANDAATGGPGRFGNAMERADTADTANSSTDSVRMAADRYRADSGDGRTYGFLSNRRPDVRTDDHRPAGRAAVGNYTVSCFTTDHDATRHLAGAAIRNVCGIRFRPASRVRPRTGAIGRYPTGFRLRPTGSQSVSIRSVGNRTDHDGRSEHHQHRPCHDARSHVHAILPRRA